MVKRQLRWYRHSGGFPETHRYNVLIINTPDEIESIRQKIRDKITLDLGATVMEEEPPIEQGLIENSGSLHFWLGTIETQTSLLKFSDIYGGEVCRERRLRPKKSVDGWNDFIQNIYYSIV